MSRRPGRREVSIEMTPFLDALAILMSVISLVLIVMIDPITRNPKQLSILSFREFRRRNLTDIRKPIYIDCRSDSATVIPGDVFVTIDELRRPGNAVETLLKRVEAGRENEYIVLLVRPHSLPVYRHLRKELGRRGMVYGADVLESHEIVDWRSRMKELNISASEY